MIRRRMTSGHDTLAGRIDMSDLRNGARGVPVQRRSRLVVGLVLALLTSGCLQDGTGTGPSSGAARLALSASVDGSAGSASNVTALRVEVSYLRGEGETARLLDQTVPLSGVASGAIVRQPVSVDLAACLADPLHQPGGSACNVMVRVTLLAGEAALDVVIIGPLTLRPGERSEPAEVTLHTASNLVVTPVSQAPLFPGETVQLTGRLLDATGAPVEGRTIEWTSNAPSVASVDASGKVTAVAPGNALITATGGDRTASVTVHVVARSTILIEPPAISFEAKHSGSPPESRSVRVVNGSAGTLDGMALGVIGYGPGADGWLDATLSGSAAPATLVLRPTRTDLAPGTYTATVPITAPTAGNSGIAVQVSYRITPAVRLNIGQTLFQLSGRYGEVPAEFRTPVTAAGPLSGLRTEVEYGPHATGWLTAWLGSESAPTDLLLRISGYQLPGNYQAKVRVTAPEAANDLTVDVLWTVPQDGFRFDLQLSDPCVVVESVASRDSVYLGATLSDTLQGTLPGREFTVRALDPGLVVTSPRGTTHDSPAVAIRDAGFTGYVRLVATLGKPPQAPGAMADTVTVQVAESYYDCYYEGGGLRAPYVPGAPALRRAPITVPTAAATPSTRPLARMRKSTSASAPPPITNRSRPTPEHN